MKWNFDRPFWVWFVCVQSSSGLFIVKHLGLGYYKILLESSFQSTCWEQFACLASKSLPSCSPAYSSMTYSLYSSHLLWQRWVPTIYILDTIQRFFVQYIDSIYVLALQSSLIILVGLTMRWFSEKMTISCGLIPNSHKKSWMVSTTYVNFDYQLWLYFLTSSVTLEFGVNVALRLLIFGLFSMGYVLKKRGGG